MEKANELSDMPEHILAAVFSYLDTDSKLKTACVCRQFDTIINETYAANVWSNMKISTGECNFPTILQKHSAHITSLNLHTRHFENIRASPKLSLPSLRFLTFTCEEDDMTEKGFAFLPPGLAKFHFHGFWTILEGNSDLRTVLACMGRIPDLKLSRVACFEASALDAVVQAGGTMLCAAVSELVAHLEDCGPMSWGSLLESIGDSIGTSFASLRLLEVVKLHLAERFLDLISTAPFLDTLQVVHSPLATVFNPDRPYTVDLQHLTTLILLRAKGAVNESILQGMGRFSRHLKVLVVRNFKFTGEYFNLLSLFRHLFSPMQSSLEYVCFEGVMICQITKPEELCAYFIEGNAECSLEKVELLSIKIEVKSGTDQVIFQPMNFDDCDVTSVRQLYPKCVLNFGHREFSEAEKGQIRKLEGWKKSRYPELDDS